MTDCARCGEKTAALCYSVEGRICQDCYSGKAPPAAKGRSLHWVEKDAPTPSLPSDVTKEAPLRRSSGRFPRLTFGPNSEPLPTAAPRTRFPELQRGLIEKEVDPGGSGRFTGVKWGGAETDETKAAGRFPQLRFGEKAG